MLTRYKSRSTFLIGRDEKVVGDKEVKVKLPLLLFPSLSHHPFLQQNITKGDSETGEVEAKVREKRVLMATIAALQKKTT